MELVHLHVHSKYSTSDGFVSVEELVGCAVAQGMRALALTDLHTIAGIPVFWELCNAQGIQPIVGAEFNVWFDDEEAVDDGHHRLIFLVETQQGYLNLVYLLNIANASKNVEHKGIRYSDLCNHTDGLLVLVGGAKSWYRRMLVQHPIVRVMPYLEFLIDPENRLFAFDQVIVALEPLSDHSDDGIIMNQYNMAKSLRFLCVAIADVRCLSIEDTILCDFTDGKNPPKTYNRASMRRSRSNKHMLTANEMAGRLGSDYHHAIGNSLFVMERCSVYRPYRSSSTTPKRDFSRGISAETYVCDKTMKDAKKRLNVRELSPEIISRLDEELQDIMTRDWANNIFLLTEIAGYCRAEKYVMGIGRGRILSSVVAYILGITQINPLDYHLKFLGFEDDEDADSVNVKAGCSLQVEVPRHFSHKLSMHLAKTLGDEHAIVVGRYEHVSGYALFQRLCHWVGAVVPNMEEAYELLLKERDAAYGGVPQTPDAVNTKSLLFVGYMFGKLRHSYRGLLVEEGLYAVSNENLLRVVPTVECDGVRVAQFDARGLGSYSIPRLSIDVVPMLDLLDMATRCVRYQEHPHFDPEKIPHDDHETFALFARGDTFGIEMFSDLRIRSILRAEQPDDYASLMKVAALVGTEQDVWNRIPDTITAYRLMFIKAHYPRSFFAALLSHSYRDLHLFMRVLRDLENRKIVLLKPDINSSQYYFSVQPKGIQVGLMVVSGMTRQAYDIISHVRQSGEFSGAVDFCSRVLNTHAMHDSELNHVSQELIENLILGGVFDSCGYDRSQLLWMYNHYLEADTQKNLSESSTITGRFRLEAAYKEVEVPLSEPMSVSEKLAGERRVLGWNPGHKVFQKWTSVLQKTNCSGTSAVTARHVGDLLSVVGILCLDAVENHPLKCEGFEVYDCEGKAVLCLPSTVETLRVTVVPGEPVVMLGRVEHLKNELAFKAEYAMPLPLVQHLIDVPARMKIDASKLTPGEYWRLSKEFRGFAKGNCTLQIRNTIFTKPTWLFPKSVIVSPLLWYAWQKVLGTNCVLETDEPLPDELRIFNGIFQLKCQARQENIGL